MDTPYIAPQQTGNDILGYQGNAVMGGGYAPGADAGANTANAEVNDMLKTLQGQQFLQNQQDYKQAIKDRDDTYNTISGLAVPADVLDKDRDALEAQRQIAKEAMLSDPGQQGGAESIFKQKEEINKFMQMANSSKSRNIEYMKQLSAAAAQQNPATRDDMLAHLDSEVKSGPNNLIKPYFNNPSFDTSMFADVPLQQVGQPAYSPDENGVYNSSTTMRTPVSAFGDFVSPTNLLANNADRLQKIQTLHKSFDNSSMSQNPDIIEGYNQRLAKINADNNTPQTSANYLQPLSVKGPDGKYITNPSPGEFGKSMYALRNYADKTTIAPAPDYQKSLHEVAQDKKLAADAEREGITASAMAKKYKADAEKSRKEGNLADAKANEDKAEVSAPAADVINMFRDIPKWQTYSDPGAVNEKFSANVLKQFTNVGYVPGSAITPLPLNNNYRLALSMMVPSVKNGNETTGAHIQKPDQVFAIQKPGGSLHDITLVGMDSAGKLLKAVNINEALTETIKANNNFSNDPKFQHKADMARQVMDEQLAGNKPTSISVPVSPVAKQKKDPKDYQTYSPTAAQAKISGHDYDKVVPHNGQTYYKIEGNFYDTNGNLITNNTQ